VTVEDHRYPITDGPEPYKGYITHTYSPGNGGDGTTPVYFYLRVGEGQNPPNCQSSTITLTMQ
jgi:hypothetical protein